MLRPGGDRLGATSARTSTCRRWWPTPGCAWRSRTVGASPSRAGLDRHDPRGAGPAGHPVPRQAAGRVRPGEHPDRLQRRRLLLLAGDPATSDDAGAGPVRRCGRCRRPRACWPSTAPTAATSSATSTAATKERRWSSSVTTAGSCSASWCSPRPSRPGSAGVREHRALGHKTLLITGRPRLRDRTASASVRRGDLRPTRRKARPLDRGAPRSPTDRARPGR